MILKPHLSGFENLKDLLLYLKNEAHYASL